MNNAWNCYLLAFKNIFNYKDSANRQELNWFVLFIIVFWILLFFIICNTVFFLVKGSMGNINPLHILPLAFIGQICGFFVIGIIIFLMIREKPIV